MFKAMVFEPGKEPYLRNTNEDNAEFLKIVKGGKLFIEPFGEDTVIVHGINKSQEDIMPNRWIGKTIIDGPFFLACRNENGKYSDLKQHQLEYFAEHYSEIEKIDIKDFRNCVKICGECVGRDEIYMNNINLDMWKNDIDLKSIVESLETPEKQAAKEYLKKIHAMFIDTFDTDCIDDLVGNETMIHVPAICKSSKTGKLMIGLVIIDVSSSGEVWDTMVMTRDAIIDFHDTKKGDIGYEDIKDFGSYDYWYTATFFDDIHTDINNAPKDVMELVDYATAAEEQTQTQTMTMDSM